MIPMRTRIEQELTLLSKVYPDLQHAEHNGEDWFLLPSYRLPPGWRIGEAPVTAMDLVFKLAPTYPTTEPYAFLAPAGVNFGGQAPASTAPAPGGPFPGTWLQFSWSPEGTWTPAANADDGSNALAWVRSFAQRLKEGA
jgi:hypothetical protein